MKIPKGFLIIKKNNTSFNKYNPDKLCLLFSAKLVIEYEVWNSTFQKLLKTFIIHISVALNT